jgi:voltage-gated potassium channel
LDRFTKLPRHILAFVMIPLLVGPFLWELSPEEEAPFTALDIFIWVIFTIVLTLKTLLAPHSLQYLRQHWLEVLIVAVPFFRPLRILRILLLTTRTFTGFRRAVNADYLIVYAVGLVMTAATVVLTLEQDVQEASPTPSGGRS